MGIAVNIGTVAVVVPVGVGHIHHRKPVEELELDKAEALLRHSTAPFVAVVVAVELPRAEDKMVVVVPVVNRQRRRLE